MLTSHEIRIVETQRSAETLLQAVLTRKFSLFVNTSLTRSEDVS